jgi:GNAT superfamily N-acetyltransferase
MGRAAAVRVAGPADVAALAGLRAGWEGVSSDPGFEQRLAVWLAAEGDRRTVWLAEVAGQPAGMASVLEYRRMPWPGRPEARWGYVGNMFVRPQQRGRGLGSALLRELVAAAERRGYARLVVRPSAEARALYARAGFAPADGSAEELLMVRSVDR